MGSRRREQLLAVPVAMVMGAGVLAGCVGEEPEPGVSESTTTSSLASASASPSEAASASPTGLATAVPMPVMPPAMANNDAAGAEAAVRYSLALYNYTYLSQDLEPWRVLSDDDCVFCNRVIENVEGLVANGERQAGGNLELNLIEVGATAEESSTYLFDVEIRQGAFEIRDSSGDVVESNGGGTTVGAFAVTYTGSGWRLLAGGSTSEDS